MVNNNEYIIHGYFDCFNCSKLYFWIEIVSSKRVVAATVSDLREVLAPLSFSSYSYESIGFNIPYKDNRPIYSTNFEYGTEYSYRKIFIDCIAVDISDFVEFERYLKDLNLTNSYSYKYLKNLYRYCISLLETKNWNISYLDNKIVIDSVKDSNFTTNFRYFCENFPTYWRDGELSIYKHVDAIFKKVLTTLFLYTKDRKIKNIGEKHILINKLINRCDLTSYDLQSMDEFMDLRLSSMEFVIKLTQESDDWFIDSGVKVNGRYRGVTSFITSETDLSKQCKGFYLSFLFDLMGEFSIFKEIYKSRFIPLKWDLNRVIDFMRNQSSALMSGGIVLQYPAILKRVKRAGISLNFHNKGGSLSRNFLNMDTLLDFDWKFSVDGEEIDEDEIYKHIEENRGFFINGGNIIELDLNKIKEVLAKLEQKRKKHSDGISFMEALSIDEEELDVRIEDLFMDRFSSVEKLCSDDLQLGRFKGELRTYQKDGVIFLKEQERAGFGAILADDMGLGKTIQIIALVQSDYRSGQSLIVVPTTVLYNWESEFNKFSPKLSTYIHYGTDRVKDVTSLEHDVILTTYGVLKKDIEKFSKIDFNRVVIDEAQSIKNPRSDQAIAVKALKSVSRIALTGTPIENRLMELWSIMDFCNRNLLLNSQDFSKFYEIPIIKNGDKSRRERLKQVISPFVLRRMKTDKSILDDLPEKTESKVYLPLTSDQLAKYDLVIKETEEMLNSSDSVNKGIMLNTIVKLKQICNSTRSESGEIFSTKYIRLKSMIKVIIDENNKVIIFSQFVETGRMITDLLENDIDGSVLFFHGSLSVKRRDKIIKEFNSNPEAKVLVLSLRAGGVGLNLTAANYVFHFDRWWNPAVENQAIDRVHRIGQVKRTFVYKFICKGTLEEKIDTIIESKIKLSTEILDQQTNFLSNLSKDQFLEIIRR